MSVDGPARSDPTKPLAGGTGTGPVMFTKRLGQLKKRRNSFKTVYTVDVCVCVLSIYIYMLYICILYIIWFYNIYSIDLSLT